MINKTLITLSLILVSIFVFGQNNKIVDRVIAVVGDNPILLSDVEEQKLQAYQQGLDPKDVECEILEELMLEKLLLHQAEIDSVEIPEAQVNSELDQRIQYFASQMPNGIEDLVKFYEKSIQEIKDEFYTQIENRMKTQEVQSGITDGIRVSPKEVKAFYKSFHEDSIPLVGSRIEISQIIMNPIITDKEKEAIKNELEALRKKIVKGDLSFEAAAKFNSCDKGSAEKNGDFGWVGRGQFVPEFEAMAYMTPIDTVSPVFESQYGFHILRIEKRRGEQFYGRHILLCTKPSFEQLTLTKKRLDSVRNQINIGNLDWEKAVELFSNDDFTKATRGIVYNQNTGTSMIAMEDLDPVTFQQIENIKLGELSKAFLFETFDGQSYKLVKLNKRTPPHKANLNDDYQMIQKFALSNNENKAVTKWVNNKLIDVYIRLEEDYQGCDFRFEWTKKN